MFSYTEFEPTSFINDAFTKIETDSSFNKNIKTVFEYNQVPYKIDENGKPLVRRILNWDKELIWNYTSRALDTGWLNTHKPGKPDSTYKSDELPPNNYNDQIAKTDFLHACEYLSTFIGALQGLKNRKNPMLLGRAICYDGKNSFDLTFKLKDSTFQSDLSNKFEEGAKNNYTAFHIYATVIPMKDKAQIEKDPHGDHDIYPSIVKCYKRVNNQWHYLKETTVNDLTEYSEFIVECMKL